MAKRLRKTLPKDFEDLVSRDDLNALQRVFETCDVNARGGVWKTPALSWFGVSEAFARWLIDQGADIECPDRHGATPLHHHAGSIQGHPQLLIELGANPHATDSSGRTPLFETGLHPAHTCTLIDAGADVHHEDEYGDTALMHTLERTGPAHIVSVAQFAEVLLQAGAQVTDAERIAVREIGERFEEIREAFNPESLPETEHALARLIAQEIDANGAVNWGARHRAMLSDFEAIVRLGTPLSVDELRETRSLVKSLRRGRGSDDELDRIRELATTWVLANPQPILG